MNKFFFRQRLMVFVLVLGMGVVGIIFALPGWAQTTTTSGDTTQPSVPTNVSVTSLSSTSIQISWSASTDNIGVIGYRINMSGAGIFFAPSLFYTISSLSPGTSYSFTVAAYDDAQNYSPQSASVSFTTQSSGGTAIPAAPTTLSLTGISIGTSYISMFWADNSTNESEFRIERRVNSGSWSQVGSMVVGNPGTVGFSQVYTDNNIIDSGTYDYRVTACNGAGCSGYSDIASRIMNTAAPTAPSGLTATYSSTAGSVAVRWIDSSTNESGFNLYRRIQGSTSWTLLSSYAYAGYLTGSSISWNDMFMIVPNTIYEYVVHSYNSFNESADSNIVTACFGTCNTTPPSDATPPSTPTGLSATAVSPSQINLSWTASTDNVEVDRYKIFRNGVYWYQVTKLNYVSSITAYADTGLSSNTSYSYYVTAVDAAGNESPASATVSATTQSGIASCSGLTITFQGGKSSYTIGETATYTYSCTPGGSAAYVEIQVVKPDGTATTYNSTSGGVSANTLGFGTSNLVAGNYTLRACFAAGCGSVTAAVPFTIAGSSTTPAPSAGAPEPSTNDTGVWAQVDVATGQVVGSAICTKSVCGLNGDYHGYVPPSSWATGSVWWPTSKRYIWQLPGQAGYGSGTFNFNTYVFTVQGGTIYNGQFTTTVTTSTTIVTTTTTTATTTQNAQSLGSSVTTVSPPVVYTPAPSETPTTTIISSHSPTFTPIAQCLQAGGLWCYSDFPTNLLGYCAPAKSACERGEQSPPTVLPQPPAVGLRVSEQFLADRRALLQDLRELERLVRRDIIELDAKQLKILKEKILSLKPRDQGDLSVLQNYQEQITSLQGDASTNTEREFTIDPRLEARALQQLKQGLRLFERHITTIQAKVAQIEKSKITVDTSIKGTIVSAKDMARRVKAAKSYNDIRDIAEQIPDIGQTLNDALPRLEELLRLPRVLRLVDRRIADGEKAIKQAGASAKRLKLDAADNLEAMRGIITNAKSTVAAVKTGGATEGLLDTLQEQVFDTLDEVFDLANHIRAVVSVRQAVNQATANVKRYEARLRRLKVGSEDKQTASELLGKFKEQLAGLKKLSTQKLTADIGDLIIEHLNVMDDLKTELEGVFGLSSLDATQEQIKRLLSAPSEKIKPFKIEQLEQGVL